MASYLRRYQQGEHVQVWKELVALGAQVRSEPFYSDARAVAQETMQRVRRNVELIHSRLQSLGYKFQHPDDAVTPPHPNESADIEEFERHVGPVPLSVRAWAEVVGSVNFTGNYPKLSFCEEQFNPFLGNQFAVGVDGQTQLLDLAALLRTQSSESSVPSEFDDALSSIRGAFASLLGVGSPTDGELTIDSREQRRAKPQGLENVGEDVLANMRTAFAAATKPSPRDSDDPLIEKDRVVSDPLVVELCGLTVEQYEAWQELEDDEIPFSVILSPDACEKANRAGDAGYEVYLPDAAADVLVNNTVGEEIPFVEYLRSSFQWAGFRELRDYAPRNEALLTSLKEGLEPF